MAKIVCGMNIDDRYDEKFDSDVLIIQRITTEQRDKVYQAEELLEEISRKAKLHPIVKFIGIAAGIGAPVCARICKAMMRGKTSEEFLQESPLLFYIMLGCGAVFLLVLLAGFIKSRIVIHRPDVKKAIEHINAVHEISRAMLGVPSDIPHTDIFGCIYRIQNGQRMIIKQGDITYMNNKVTLFREDDMLCIVDAATKIGIRLDSIKSIRRINQRTTVSQWNKQEKHNKGEYREYKITETKKGEPIFRYYYALCFTHDGEDFEMYFPPYELARIESLTNVRADM